MCNPPSPPPISPLLLLPFRNCPSARLPVATILSSLSFPFSSIFPSPPPPLRCRKLLFIVVRDLLQVATTVGEVVMGL
ncbi:hypothetical protein I3760_15G063300 [Carya illinoinensis]|nr:hypothetical protein I3760_15G063300 [Carya illinoinensis]